MTPQSVIERSVFIARPVEEVFDFVADATNDPRWCPRVSSCEQTQGNSPGAGAAYRAQHNPTLVRTDLRELVITDYERPHHIRWRQDDKSARFVIDYRLEPVGNGTRLTQRDEIEWEIPSVVAGVVRHVVPLRIASQFRRLKRLLEDAP